MKIQFIEKFSGFGTPLSYDIYMSFRYERTFKKALNSKGLPYDKLKSTTTYCFINVCDPNTHAVIMKGEGKTKHDQRDVFDKEIARKYALFRALGGRDYMVAGQTDWDFSKSPFNKDIRKVVCDAYFNRPRGNSNKKAVAA